MTFAGIFAAFGWRANRKFGGLLPNFYFLLFFLNGTSFFKSCRYNTPSIKLVEKTGTAFYPHFRRYTRMGQQRIEVKNVAGVTVATTLDMKLNDDLSISEWGDQLLAIFDDGECKKLLVNFERVLFMSSSALRALITLNKKSKEGGASLVLCGIDDNIMEAFRITRLDNVFTIKKNEDEGIKAFA
jgi:anti-sigma B factor antagonist